MREHLYRALTNTCGSNEPSAWVYGAVAKFENVSGEIYTAILPEIDGQNLMCELKRVIPETICEYTGLTDKNGKRIFEGDVIKVDYDGWCNGLFDYQHLYSENYEVYFDDNHHAWFTRFPKFEEPLEMLWEYDESCEVIGTIFDEVN